MKTTLVSYEEFTALDFKDPSAFYIKLATGEYLFIHTRDRAAAQQYVNDEYGGRYTLRSGKPTKTKPKYETHQITARG